MSVKMYAHIAVCNVKAWLLAEHHMRYARLLVTHWLVETNSSLRCLETKACDAGGSCAEAGHQYVDFEKASCEW